MALAHLLLSSFCPQRRHTHLCCGSYCRLWYREHLGPLLLHPPPGHESESSRRSGQPCHTQIEDECQYPAWRSSDWYQPSQRMVSSAPVGTTKTKKHRLSGEWRTLRDWPKRQRGQGLDHGLHGNQGEWAAGGGQLGVGSWGVKACEVHGPSRQSSSKFFMLSWT